MATVTQAIALASTLNPFDSPAAREGYKGSMPFGELTLAVQDTILALGAGDVGVYTTTGTLPRNYYYKLASIYCRVAGTSEAQMDNPAVGMACLFSENQVGEHFFGIYNEVRSVTTGSGAFNAIQAANPSVTNDFITYYKPWGAPSGLYTDLIDASEGVSQFQAVWVDGTPTTTAMDIIWRLRFNAYTIEQGKAAASWNITSV